MPIFIKVESKSLSGRLFHAGTFIFLTLAGMTMIYPFLLMISGSFRSEMDESQLDLIPAYFHQESALYQKFLEFKYQQDINAYNNAHLDRAFAFRLTDVPEDTSEAAARDLRLFFEETNPPFYWQRLGGVSGTKTVPENLRKLRHRLAERFDGDIKAFSRETGMALTQWNQIAPPPPEWLSPRFDFYGNALNETYLELMAEAPYAGRQLVSLSGHFLEMIVFPQYGDLDNLNRAFGTTLASLGEFRLPQTVPDEDQSAFREQWVDFALRDLNASFIAVVGIPDADYQSFLSKAYKGDIEQLNLVWESEYSDFSGISLPGSEFIPGAIQSDYREFLASISPEHWRLTGPEYAWSDWLRDRYGNVNLLSEAHGRDYTSFAQAWLPFADLEMQYVLENRWSLRLSYATRNFINVYDAVFLEGRVFLNTVIFCTLSVLLAILVNPLAAYALSRFQLPGTYKLLLLMMAVMAFPPMVTTIPVFLMMQKMGLMNTFAGLVLPTIANGYLIFLLKGFFDSLPRELYEAAQIEGASEFRMFFSITMALSKPILAVVALTAFNAAYTSFLFALIIAPEQDMWLMSVWLYQYRGTVSMGGVFASVLVASIPPITVFLFAQNIILRGIVVPVEK